MSVEEHRNIARQKMKGHCGVYKHCDGADGRVCQRNAYGKSIGFGGVGSGQSFKNNYNALQMIKLKMRVVGENYTPDTTYEFFGNKLTLPVMGASLTGVNSFVGDT